MRPMTHSGACRPTVIDCAGPWPKQTRRCLKPPLPPALACATSPSTTSATPSGTQSPAATPMRLLRSSACRRVGGLARHRPRIATPYGTDQCGPIPPAARRSAVSASGQRPARASRGTHAPRALALLRCKFGPDGLPVVRTQVLSRYRPARRPLDCRAPLGRHRTQPHPPLVDHRRTHADDAGDLGRFLGAITGEVFVQVHAATIALL